MSAGGALQAFNTADITASLAVISSVTAGCALSRADETPGGLTLQFTSGNTARLTQTVGPPAPHTHSLPVPPPPPPPLNPPVPDVLCWQEVASLLADGSWLEPINLLRAVLTQHTLSTTRQPTTTTRCRTTSSTTCSTDTPPADQHVHHHQQQYPHLPPQLQCVPPHPRLLSTQ